MSGKNFPNRALGSFAQEKEVRRASMVNRAVGATIPNFDAESRANEVFKIKLTNTAVADKVIVLHPGMLLTTTEISSILGVTTDAIGKDGVVIADAVSCATKNGTSLEFLQRFVNNNPTRIIKIQVEASTETQLSEDLVFAKINPFAKVGETPLNPAAQKKETNNQSKLVTLTPNNIQLDDQTVWYVNLLAGATLTLNLTMGVSSNAAAVLETQSRIVYGQ